MNDQKLWSQQICVEDLFANVYTVSKWSFIQHGTACTSELSFSSLKRLKTHHRTTQSENRLNGLLMLNIHRNENITPDNITEELITKSED